MEVNALICAPATDHDLESALSNWHKCQDQKVGELFLRGEGSKETLVEPRSDTDVQIVCYTWVKERSTDGTIWPLVPSTISSGSPDLHSYIR